MLIPRGIGFTYGNWLSLAALILLSLVGLINRIHVEEAALSATLGTAYTANARHPQTPHPICLVKGLGSFTVALIALVAVSTGCGSTPAPSSSASAAARITGAQSCPSDQAQDLTLTGGLVGHIGCSIAPPACHRIHGPGSPGVQVLIVGTSGSKTVILRIAFGDDHLGTFIATPIGDQPNLDQQGVTLKGIGTWSSPPDGGTMTVLVEDAPSLNSEGRVSGSLDIKLTSGASRAAVRGSWTCFKTLDGGDGWSSA